MPLLISYLRAPVATEHKEKVCTIHAFSSEGKALESLLCAVCTEQGHFDKH